MEVAILKKIIIVDDDKEILKLLEIYLTAEGFDTIKASNGAEAIELLKTNDVDLMVLDIMMPVMDGISACMEIRKNHKFPIIFLSAKSTDVDRITGISTGADDYIVKPFNPMEVIVRIKSIFRRMEIYTSNEPKKSGVLEIGDLKLVDETHEVYLKDESIVLTPTEYDILKLLMEAPSRVYTFKQIYENVWNDEYFESKNTIMVHIRKLREKVEDDPKEPTYIKTVWGVGYKIDG